MLALKWDKRVSRQKFMSTDEQLYAFVLKDEHLQTYGLGQCLVFWIIIKDDIQIHWSLQED